MSKYNLENNPLFAAAQETETGNPEKPGRGRPKKNNIIREGSQAGLTEEFTRATFIVNVDLLEEVKNYAYTERLSMKNAINELLSNSLESYKKNGGKLLDRNNRKS